MRLCKRLYTLIVDICGAFTCVKLRVPPVLSVVTFTVSLHVCLKIRINLVFIVLRAALLSRRVPVTEVVSLAALCEVEDVRYTIWHIGTAVR